jgi:hypothetical protein
MAGPGRPGPECQISRLLTTLPDGEAEVLTMALTDRYDNGDPTYSGRLVAEAATEVAQRNGLNETVHRMTVDTHRRHECRCSR